MIPDMSDVLMDFEQDIILVSTIQDVVEHRPVDIETSHQIKAVIQVASNDILNVDKTDFTQSFYQVHIRNELLLSINLSHNDKIRGYKNVELKVIEIRNFNEYGYIEVICEEVIG